ncbi:MAG: peptidoglycan-binding domain-containing protein, partial [bacterium]
MKNIQKRFACLPIIVFVLAIIPHFVLATIGDVDPSPQQSSCVSLQNNLRYKTRDNLTNGEVSTLQDFLQSQGYLSSEPTGYFGLLTLRAIKDFQSASDIASTGYVGPITRETIRAKTCSNQTAVSVGVAGQVQTGIFATAPTTTIAIVPT